MPANLQANKQTPHMPAEAIGRVNGLGLRAGGLGLRAGGLFLLALSLTVWLSLATWSHTDPSLNHATETTPQNLLGFFGAGLSDLLFQWIGLAAILIAAPTAVWGWKLLIGRPLDLNILRLAIWPVGVAALATTFAAITAPGGWPLATGLGGLLGDLLNNTLSQAAAAAGVSPVMAMAGTILIMPILGIWSIGMASNLSLRELQADANSETAPETAPKTTSTAPAQTAQPAIDAPALKRANPTHHVPANLATAPTVTPMAGETITPTSHAAVVAAGQIENRAPQTMLEKATDPYMVFSQTSDIASHADTAKDQDAEITEVSDDSVAEKSSVAKTQDDVANAQLQALSAHSQLNATQTDAAISQDAQKIEPEVFTAKTPAPSGYEFPPLDMLKSDPLSGNASGLTEEDLTRNGALLESVLQDFGIQGQVIGFQPGPVVTLYEFEPARGVKSARVINLADDIARSMSTMSARVAVVPGRNIIGVELSNKKRRFVYLRDILEADKMNRSKAALPLALGTDIGGGGVVVDLAKMPHLLIAGTTGSGKSVGINTMICSLLSQLTPDQCKFILIDPKMLELSAYDGIPHLLTPVVTDPKKAVRALKWTVREMEQRYLKMSKLGVRNIDSFNKRIREAANAGEVITRKVQTGFDKDQGTPIYEEETLELEPLPFIVVVVDEMADLMMVAGKDIEGAVQRLAQMARAAGIHLITATQRPSVDVITGTIKANFPTRISFQVTSRIDSRTILGEQGAEQLLGQGDMLYMAGGGRITRVHGPFVSEEEVEQIAEHLKRQGVPEYLSNVTEDDVLPEAKGKAASKDDANAELYQEAVEIVLRDERASTSYIQRRLSIGYNRAASLIERMEEDGIISAANNAGKREILSRRGDHGDEEAQTASEFAAEPQVAEQRASEQEDVETVH